MTIPASIHAQEDMYKIVIIDGNRIVKSNIYTSFKTMLKSYTSFKSKYRVYTLQVFVLAVFNNRRVWNYGWYSYCVECKSGICKHT